MSTGFTCSKNALIALNILYLAVTVILIAVGAYAHRANIVQSLGITGGIIAAGVFLFFVAIMGIIGACKHHQVILFFYMVILFLIFILQFIVSVACLAVNQNQRHLLAQSGWRHASNDTLRRAQMTFHCCDFKTIEKQIMKSSCLAEFCETPCPNCWDKLNENMGEALRVTGCIGLFFSFTEVLGIWLASRFRNLKDPRANPNAFL